MEYGNIVRQYDTLWPERAWSCLNQGSRTLVRFPMDTDLLVYVGTHNIVVKNKLQEQEKAETSKPNPQIQLLSGDWMIAPHPKPQIQLLAYRQATPFSVWSKSRPKFKATSLLGNITSILSVRSSMSVKHSSGFHVSSWNNPFETYSDSIYFSGKGASLQLNSVIHWKLRTQ